MNTPSHRGIKTTLEIPETLWKRAKRGAVDERTTLRELILDGLEWRLSPEGKRGAAASNPKGGSR